MDYMIPVLCIIGIFAITLTLFLLSAIRVVREETRLSVYRLGRYMGDKGPGLVVLIPFIDRGVLKELGEVRKNASQSLMGATGETCTTVFTDGKVFLSGEEWNALSQSPISAGQRVRVVKVILEVEKE